MSKKTGKGRGFASMTAQQRQLLASMGGKATLKIPDGRFCTFMQFYPTDTLSSAPSCR